MGFLDSIKRVAKAALRFVVNPSTSEEVRQELRSTGAEVVESKPIPVAAAPRIKVQPARYREGYVLGETFDLGINRVKRAIRALPKKEQRAARTAFIKNLRASGVKK
ncbi:hypothetical protein [Stenotrophomonas phage SB2]|uniref:Uncharacterized protein n=1 Tax=Stenotrophomonas phage SB2 TaxID=3117468 RepID=A0ABZ2GVV5_9CAUD